MDQEIKEKWITALRSGKYKQGQKVLRSVQGGKNYFCCWGVLCDLVAPEDWADRPLIPSGYQMAFEFSDGTVAMPPDALINRVGISYDDISHVLGEDDPTDVVHYLARKNDSGITFDDIADFIEENL